MLAIHFSNRFAEVCRRCCVFFRSLFLFRYRIRLFPIIQEIGKRICRSRFRFGCFLLIRALMLRIAIFSRKTVEPVHCALQPVHGRLFRGAF